MALNKLNHDYSESLDVSSLNVIESAKLNSTTLNGTTILNSTNTLSSVPSYFLTTQSDGTIAKIAVSFTTSSSTPSGGNPGDIVFVVASIPTPTPIAPTPIAPTPVTPTPVAPTPVTPVAPTPTPVTPTPVSPTPTPVPTSCTPSYTSYGSVVTSNCPSYTGVSGCTTCQQYLTTNADCSTSLSWVCIQTNNPTFASGPTVTGITNTGGTLSWTSTNQASYSISAPGTALDGASGYTATSRLFTGLSAGTTYNYSVTLTSSGGGTVTGSGSFTTTGGTPTPVTPTPVTPTPVTPTPVTPTPVAPTPTPVTPTPTPTSYSLNPDGMNHKCTSCNVGNGYPGCSSTSSCSYYATGSITGCPQ